MSNYPRHRPIDHGRKCSGAKSISSVLCLVPASDSFGRISLNFVHWSGDATSKFTGQADWSNPSTSQEILKPFYPSILFFASSALSHIFAEIRVDAVQIVNLLLGLSPETVVSGWWTDGSCTTQSHLGTSAPSKVNGRHGRRLLQLYMSMLSIGADPSTCGLSSTSSSQLTEAVTCVLYLNDISAFHSHLLMRATLHYISSQSYWY